MEHLQFSANLEKLEEIDKVKSRVLKYIFYKKRTENEIRNKFKDTFDQDIFEQVIEQLKELGYINDTNYIDRAVNEFIALKCMSMKELKYKLLAKGLITFQIIMTDYVNMKLILQNSYFQKK